MSHNAARLLFAACLLGALASARAEGERHVWTERSSEGMILLSYGPLDANQQPVFFLSCFNEMGVAALEVFGAIEGAQPGEKLSIELSSGSSHAIEGEVARDDKTGTMFAEASGIKLGPVLDVLNAPGPLTVTMAATSLTLSEAGRADAVQKFRKDCILD
jgi:hypothetical protein